MRHENSKEILIKEGRFEFIKEQEKPYVEACIDALKPSGDVLEVGFGCGYSATQIQTFLPKSHTIIEYHPVVIEQAKNWAMAYDNVVLVEDTWQEALTSLGIFDSIFFDDYPLELAAADEETHLKYSDEDLDGVFHLLPTVESAPLEYIFSFFCELREKKQITQLQQDYLLKKMQKQRNISEGTLQAFWKNKEKKGDSSDEEHDQVSHFFETCFENHMRKGSSLSCFISDPTSKFQESAFHQSMMESPLCDYKQELISIEASENYGYYHKNQSLVITITKN